MLKPEPRRERHIWSKPEITDVDAADKIRSFVGFATDTMITDPTTS